MRQLILFCLLSAPLYGVAAEEIYPGYVWQKLDKDIYLHTQADPLAGPVDGNSTVIFDDDGVVVVDTHINPAVTRAVVDKIRATTDAPVTHVINTHWHDDHTNGNFVYRQAFPDVKIVAHSETLAMLRREWQTMEDQRRTAYAEVDVEALRRVSSDPDPAKGDRAIAYGVYADYVAALRPELSTLELEYPDTVFEDSLDIDLKRRRVELRWLGRGNTVGDIVVWLPGEKILLTGDLLVAPIPFAFDSPMNDWGTTLGRLADLKATILVPGHGAAQYDGRYLELVQTLIEVTTNRVRQAREKGTVFEDLSGAVDLSDFRDQFAGDDAKKLWAWSSYFFSPGLKSAWTSLGYPLPAE